jgi:hypothetical protein
MDVKFPISELTMLLYAARLSDLGPNDLLVVACGCGQ